VNNLKDAEKHLANSIPLHDKAPKDLGIEGLYLTYRLSVTNPQPTL
jgi:hypothetical protein